jgi:uncharacterized repeat protein (TIGR03837 family)
MHAVTINPATQQRWDIFCNIVDNFGDIGVCWRLSQQLAIEYGLSVRLFIDDFYIASKIIPKLDLTKHTQTIQGVEITAWPTNEVTLPDVVVENFSCQLPENYIHQIANHHKSCNPENAVTWINLEYLSAEHWVNDCHALPSTHPILGITKYFFFPGFTEKTGGLLREQDLLTKRDAFLNSPNQQQAFWQKISPVYQQAAFADAINISLFSYPQADIQALISALVCCEQAVNVFLPFNTEITSLNTIIQAFHLNLGEVKQLNRLKLHLLPFLSQAEYDTLLWACDLNFVRGEDSWIRAIWAGKPFIWQPYIQKEDAHIKKLDAFLAAYTEQATTSIRSIICNTNRVWSNAITLSNEDFWLNLLQSLDSWQTFSLAESKRLAAHPSLAAQLVSFCQDLKVKDLKKNTV